MSKRKAILALALLVPAPSLGGLCGMVLFPNTALGVFLFGASKVWLFGLPVVWWTFVCRQRLGWSPPRNGGFLMGVLSGLGISAFILVAYFALGRLLVDREFFVAKMLEVGFASPGIYIGTAAYWIFVNSLLEEYVWRWFCVKQCEQLLRPVAAVLCSALFFTLHHILVMSVYLDPVPVLICSIGVFAGGAIWSGMYVRYRSIWPGYLSHAIVDLCVFAIGGFMLFV